MLKFVYLLRQWVWLILLVGVLAGGAAYLISIRTTPIYETTTRLLVTRSSPVRAGDESGVDIPQTLLSTVSRMLTDTPILDAVIEKLKLELSTDALRATIDVQVIQGTQLISVRVQNPLPGQAVEIANTLGQVFAGRFREIQSSTIVTATEPAQFPTRPIWPQTIPNTILAVGVGMLLAIAGIWIVDTCDDTLRDPDEIRKKFNLPILGMIGHHTLLEGKPATQEHPRSPLAESFRSLRTNILYTAVDAPLRRVLIASATPEDGKTTVIANLGGVMANSEHKVTIIDADMRRPQIHRRFGLPNRSGLSFLFVSPLENIGEAIQSTNVPGLTIITSGVLPPNPVELLTSRKMTQILDRLNQESDMILIDTPPLLSVTDAAALVPLIDGVVLVVKPGETRRGAFRQAVEQLQSLRARILGVVLNDVNPKNHRYGYYYSHYDSKYSNYYGTKKS
jgi:capsular exopolysaccharide synthesis family protein